jgi:hypothetical protein
VRQCAFPKRLAGLDGAKGMNKESFWKGNVQGQAGNDVAAAEGCAAPTNRIMLTQASMQAGQSFLAMKLVWVNLLGISGHMNALQTICGGTMR